jgi:hypothetical protein
VIALNRNGIDRAAIISHIEFAWIEHSVQASGFTVRHHLLGVLPQQVYPSTSQRSSALERNKGHNTLWEKDVIEQTVPIKWEIRYG